MLDLIMRKSFDPWWNGLQDFNYAANWRNSSWGIIKGAETYEPTSVLLGDMAFLRLAHIGGPYIGKGTNAPLLVHTRGTSGPAPCGSFTLAVIQGWHLKKHERAIDALYRLLRGQSSQERDASKDSALHNAMRYPMVLMVMGDQYLPDRLNETAPMEFYSIRGTRISSRLNVDLLTHPALAAWGVHNPSQRISVRPSAARKLFAFPRGTHSTPPWQAIFANRTHEAAQLVRRRARLLHCSCINNFRDLERQPKMLALRRNGFDCHEGGNNCQLQPFSSKFTFSPRGNSAQNFRDWEALLAGSIPVVDYDPATSPLFDGLPVVEVRDWSLITPSYLEAKWLEIQSQSYSWEKIYFPFWLGKLFEIVQSWHERNNTGQ